MTHGFFIIMGGFHLFEHSSEETNYNYPCESQEDDKPLHLLKESDLSCYSESFTMPTEAEIKDRGKSDWLAKFLVLLQTSWFVMQCIVCGIKHLPVTHLEIVTLAYAAMNFMIYIFWWNIPLNVNRPVRVFQKSGESEPGGTQHQPISEAWKLTWESVLNGLKMIFKFITGIQDQDVNLSREDRVPRFWANSTGNDFMIADLIMLGVGICFGAIHCIAWGFSFPTHAELLIWQVSSVTITAVPIFIPLMYSLGFWLEHTDFSTVANIAILSLIPAGLLYIIARAVTLVLALTSLRELPPGALNTVHWTTFIPHV